MAAFHGQFRNTLTGQARSMPGDGAQPADIGTLACDATFQLKPEGGFIPVPSNAGTNVSSGTVLVTAITGTTDPGYVIGLLITVAALPLPVSPTQKWTCTLAALQAASAGARLVLTPY